MTSLEQLTSVSEWALTLVAPKQDAANASARWQADGLLVREVRGRKARTETGLFDEFAAALQFRHYFGENWAAFNDCMSDLEWLPFQVGIVVLIYDADAVLSDGGQLVTLVRSLKDAARSHGMAVADGEPWDRGPVPFHVVLHAEEPVTFGRWASAGAALTPLA